MCCCDTSRKKFKLIDLNGNLREDIRAKFFCDTIRVQIQIQTITKEVHGRIIERIEEEQRNSTSEIREKLLHNFMEVHELFAEVFYFNDHNSNSEFMSELCRLLNIN